MTVYDSVAGRTWTGILRRHAERDANKPAVRSGSERWSYGELVQAADALAAALLERGLCRGDVVAVMLDTSVYVPAAVAAIHSAGLVLVPVSTKLPAAEVRHQLEHAEARLVIADAERLELARQWAVVGDRGLLTVGVSAADARGADRVEDLIAQQASAPDVEIDPFDLATIMYTSGTTSHPKGVMLSHGNYVYNTELLKRLYGYGPDDVGLGVFPLFHMNGHNYQMVTWLTAGAEAVLMPRFSASGFSRQAVEFGATVASLNSTHVKMILSKPRVAADSEHKLRMVKFGMSLDPARIAEFEAIFGVRLHLSYSQTESIGPIVFNPPEGLGKPEALGLPVLGATLRLVDEDGADVGRGEVGEILLKTASPHGVCLGYHKDPEATAAARLGDWWRTQDLGRFDEDGFLWFAGRRKDMIKHSGFNVAAAEVERVLNAHPDIADSAVIGVPDEIHDEAIKAIVVLRDGVGLELETVRAYCSGELADYKLPGILEVTGELPRTAAGKVDKRVVRERHGAGAAA
jgi:crotonobetaine/carnitine-CoA ligase